jgi:hypothetical protein
MGNRDEASMAHNVEERGLVPAEVLELLDERGKVQSWVEKLSDLESEASPAVYDKVLTDYRERLAGLSERLTSHRGAVQTTLDEVRERLARLAQERAERVAALEEAKLRFTVGEYADKEWERHRETDGQAVAELEESLGVENEARQELERILSELPDASGRVSQPPAWMPALGAAEIPPRSPEEDEDEDLDTSVAAAATPAAAYVVEPRDEDVVGADGEEEGIELPEIAPEPAVEPTIDTDELAAHSAETAEADPAERGGPTAGLVGTTEGEARVGGSTPEDTSHLDELAFLESLTLDDTERFDAVSAMLEEGEEKGKDDEEERPH